MNWELIKEYIDSQPIKVVTLFDIENKKIKYDGIVQNRKIDTITGDEEVVRAYILTKLVNELHYKLEKIEIEREYEAGRPKRIKPRIDIIVKDDNDDNFLYIELKKPEGADSYDTIDKDKTIEDQLYKLAGIEESKGKKTKYLVLYTARTHISKTITDDCIIIDKEKYHSFPKYENNRDVSNTLPNDYGKARKTPYIKGSDRDLQSEFEEGYLLSLSNELHNVLWGGGGTDDNDVFASLTNLILAKIEDEGNTDIGETYQFQSYVYDDEESNGDLETDEQLFDRINEIYRKALKDKLYIRDNKQIEKSFVVDTNKFSLQKLKYTVQKLEGISFVEGKNSLNGKDILGTFFENIIREGFKQTKGQFFTPENIVNFMLYAVQADKQAITKVKETKELPYMIDPSAGSGTFLIAYMKFITENLKYKNRANDGKYNHLLGNTEDIKDKITSDWFYPDHRENKWAKDYIYGMEINFNLGTATKVNMILHGDGSTNIFVKDGLLSFDKYEKATGINALGEHHKSSNYKHLGEKLDVNEKFDILLSNPPFSVELDNDTKKSIKKNFQFGSKKNSQNLFIERYFQLLKSKGRLAVVLPESVFDNSDNRYIRIFIFRYFNVKAIVSLPQLTFEPYTSTKTSILFAQKKSKEEIEMWDKKWNDFSKEYTSLHTIVSNIMKVSRGEKEKNRLPSIKDMTEQEEKENILNLLSFMLDERDRDISKDEIIKKYNKNIELLLQKDKDTKDEYGHINIWWVFSHVAKEMDYDYISFEANEIGYKRGKKKIRKTPNELYRTDNNNNIIVDDGNIETILDKLREVEW